MQIEIVSSILDQVASNYQAAEAALQALDQEFRAIMAASAEPGSLTFIERAHAAFVQLPAVVTRRDELSANMGDLQAFAATIAANAVAHQKSDLLKQLDRKVQALSEEIQSKRSQGLFIDVTEQNRCQRLVNQYGSDLVGDIEQRIRQEVGKSQTEETKA